jgi:hypothetical protein
MSCSNDRLVILFAGAIAIKRPTARSSGTGFDDMKGLVARIRDAGAWGLTVGTVLFE